MNGKEGKSEPGFVIFTRQKADSLFNPNQAKLLGAGATFASAVAEVDGYASVAFLVISDQPFTLRTQEACTPTGPFTQTSSTASALDAASGLQRVCLRVTPCGSFMQMFIDNLGAVQKILQFCPYGLPV